MTPHLHWTKARGVGVVEDESTCYCVGVLVMYRSHLGLAVGRGDIRRQMSCKVDGEVMDDAEECAVGRTYDALCIDSIGTIDLDPRQS